MCYRYRRIWDSSHKAGAGTGAGSKTCRAAARRCCLTPIDPAVKVTRISGCRHERRAAANRYQRSAPSWAPVSRAAAGAASIYIAVEPRFASKIEVPVSSLSAASKRASISERKRESEFTFVNHDSDIAATRGVGPARNRRVRTAKWTTFLSCYFTARSDREINCASSGTPGPSPAKNPQS